MSLRFPYRLMLIGHSVLPLGGRNVRPRPIIPITIGGPGANSSERAIVDTGADDTLFPDSVARRIGLDLSGAPSGSGAGVGMASVHVRYGVVMLRVASGLEKRQWQAWVGFTAAPLRHPILGFAGFLQFFDALFFGGLEVVELTVNGLYPGT
jgi:hypothetical protein